MAELRIGSDYLRRHVKENAFRVQDVKLYDLYKREEVRLLHAPKRGSRGNSEPLPFVTIAKLLGNVNDRDEIPFVSIDGFLNMNLSLYMYSMNSREESGRHSDDRSLAELIQSSVYVERSPSTTGHDGRPFVDFYAAVKNGDDIYRVLISAKDSNTKQGKFDVKDVGLYDFYPKGTSLKSEDYELKRSGPTTAPNIDAARRRTTPLVTVADLLRGVKGRDGKDLLNEDESLNLDPRLNMYSMNSGEERGRPSTGAPERCGPWGWSWTAFFS